MADRASAEFSCTTSDLVSAGWSLSVGWCWGNGNGVIDFPEFCKFYLMLGRFGRSYPSLIYGIPWFSSPSFVAVVLVECRGMSWNVVEMSWNVVERGEIWWRMERITNWAICTEAFATFPSGRRVAPSPADQRDLPGCTWQYLASLGNPYCPYPYLSIFIHIYPWWMKWWMKTPHRKVAICIIKSVQFSFFLRLSWASQNFRGRFTHP